MAVYPKTIVPTTIPGLIVWYDAVDLLNNGTQPADGTAVSSWKDKSGFGRHLTQPTGGNQPLYKAATIGGLPSVLFDGVDDSLLLTDITLPLSQTSIAVFTSTNSGTGGEILSTQTNAGGRYQILRYDNFTGYGLASYNGVAYNRTISPSFGADPRYLVLAQAGGAMQYYINQETVTAASTNNESYHFGQVGNLGAGANNPFKGYIGEILIYSHTLLDAERTIVVNYLINKWGLKP